MKKQGYHQQAVVAGVVGRWQEKEVDVSWAQQEYSGMLVPAQKSHLQGGTLRSWASFLW